MDNIALNSLVDAWMKGCVVAVIAMIVFVVAAGICAWASKDIPPLPPDPASKDAKPHALESGKDTGNR